MLLEILKDRIIYEDIFLSNILTQDVSSRISNATGIGDEYMFESSHVFYAWTSLKDKLEIE